MSIVIASFYRQGRNEAKEWTRWKRHKDGGGSREIVHPLS